MKRSGKQIRYPKLQVGQHRRARSGLALLLLKRINGWQIGRERFP